uniref:Uncharacterized protein n=1 Tax=Arundo donax TaxID=35708 RepID=A0A0A9BL10_ARUDO
MDLEILPEWLGQLICLEVLTISECPNVTSLPASIKNLTAMKRLHISHCPRLIQRCRGEDSHKISHIPEVTLDFRRFISGQGSESKPEHAVRLSGRIRLS